MPGRRPWTCGATRSACWRSCCRRSTPRHAITVSDARLTVGIIETSPGSPNTVPGRLRVIVDLRHPASAQYRSLRAEVDRLVAESLQRQGLEGSIRCVWEAPGVEFDAECVEARARGGGGA